jgi:hypothetical protein
MSNDTAGLPPTSWGPWTFDRDRLVLYNQNQGYEIDLERCLTSAEVLDWIAQIEAKSWCDVECLNGLVRAFCDLLRPQEVMCSFGQSREIAPDQIAKRVREKELQTLASRELSTRRAGRIEEERSQGGLYVMNMGEYMREHDALVEEYRHLRDHADLATAA